MTEFVHDGGLAWPVDLAGPAQLARRGDVIRASTRVRALVIVNVVVAAAYAGWWMMPGHIGSPVLFAALAVAEGFTLAHSLGLWTNVWASKIEMPPRYWTPFAIDVFVPTCGEPLKVIAKTVRAAVAMDVPHKTFVLDDARRPEVRLIAQLCGAGYLTRPDNHGAKAGNLNHALAETNGDLVAVFDADHVPERDFLAQLVGYFEDGSVALVQTPQYYGNAVSNEVARGAYEQQAVFYGPICRGKNGQESAFCCGTNMMMRRSSLRDVGGFVEDSVVEDFVTSIRLHRAGWRSIYFPYALATGLGPSNLATYFRQQARWARGSIDAFVRGEPLRRGLSLVQRAQYLLATTFYLIGLATAVYILLPILYLLFGLSAFSQRSGSFVLFYAPYFGLGLLTLRIGLGDQLRPAHLRYTFGAFPVYVAAAVAAVTRRTAQFHVTGRASAARERPPALAWVTVGAAFLTALAIVVGGSTRPFTARTVTNIAWGSINLMLLWGITKVTLHEALQQLPSVRRRALAAQLLPLVEMPQQHVITDVDTLQLPERILGANQRPRLVPMPRRPLRWLAALTAVGLGVRLALIDTQSMRLDESATAWQSRLPLWDLWHYLLSSNVHVPLYHTMMHEWVRFAGTSLLSLRLPSVLLGALAVPLMYALAARLLNRRTALIAAGLTATAPFLVWHSDEARMYPMLLVAVLASLLALMQAADRGGWYRWVGYGVLMALSCYVHYYALLMVPIHLVWLLLQGAPRRKYLHWFAAMTIPVAAFSPWVVALYLDRISTAGGASLTNGGANAIHDVGALGYVVGIVVFISTFLVGYQSATFVAAIASGIAGAWPLLVYQSVVHRRVAPERPGTRAVAFLFVWMVSQVVGVFVFTQFFEGAWYQRYLMAAAVPTIILMAHALHVSARRFTTALAIAVGASLVLTLWSNYSTANPMREDFRGAGAYIQAHRTAHDVVVVAPQFDVEPLSYYVLDAHRLPGISPASAEAALPRLLPTSPGASLWVVWGPYGGKDLRRELAGYLSTHLVRIDRTQLGPDLSVDRYAVPSSALKRGGP